MHVLVTGGGGYIGSVLVRRLLERGHSVRVLDRLYWGTPPLQDVLEDVEIVHADIREAKTEWFAGIDGVVHLAGLSNDPTANFDPEANWEMNAQATADIALAARSAGVQRFVFGSRARCTMACQTARSITKRRRLTRAAPTRNRSASVRKHCSRWPAATSVRSCCDRAPSSA